MQEFLLRRRKYYGLDIGRACPIAVRRFRISSSKKSVREALQVGVLRLTENYRITYSRVVH